MNRIILIGNGFDKAHGLPTSYKEFIDSYWSKLGENICNQGIPKIYEDEFVEISIRHIHTFEPNELKTIKCYADFETLFDTHDNEMEVLFKNQFFAQLSKASLKNWVDVENEYYSALVQVLKNRSRNPKNEISELNNLNKDFDAIRHLLEAYLSGIIKTDQKFDSIQKEILAPLTQKDIAHTHKMALIKHVQQRVDRIDVEKQQLQRNGIDPTCFYGKDENEIKDILEWVDKIKKFDERGNRRQYIRKNIENLPDYLSLPEEIMLLNFNYTNTAKRYIPNKSPNTIPNVQCINIHGQLNDKSNPMIFGYGDELDDNYKAIEDRNDNRYLEYIKSTSYHKTDNYRLLLEFAESGYFQIFIMGHSCGNSDRTLLNTLFEHKNCMSIKPFYYRAEDGTDNYSDIVRNISRNFKDKQLMRARVVNQTYCEPLLK